MTSASEGCFDAGSVAMGIYVFLVKENQRLTAQTRQKGRQIVTGWNRNRMTSTCFCAGGDIPLMILLTYDVNTSSESGARRLRMVARACEAYGVRVQKSVFELVLEPAQFVALKGRLSDIIDSSHDSVRFYNLGANYKRRIETLGQIPRIDQDGVLIL
jgi:CRISPR-associated protein Cas2